MKSSDFISEGFPRPYGTPNPYGTNNKQGTAKIVYRGMKYQDYLDKADAIHALYREASRKNDKALMSKLEQQRKELDDKAKQGLLPEEKETVHKPRIRKYTYERPDGSIATRYEVLDSKGRRVSGQGSEGFDDETNAKALLKTLLKKISEEQEQATDATQTNKPNFKDPKEQLQRAVELYKMLSPLDQKTFKKKLINSLNTYYAPKDELQNEGQIYSGGNKEAGVHWYKPRSVPNQNELEGVAEDQAPMFTPESLGMPYPGTYEQKTLPLRTKGQKRTQAIAFEEALNRINEKWSQKYKKSIDCSHPKGFSQRAHCQGRKKNK